MSHCSPREPEATTVSTRGRLSEFNRFHFQISTEVKHLQLWFPTIEKAIPHGFFSADRRHDKNSCNTCITNHRHLCSHFGWYP